MGYLDTGAMNGHGPAFREGFIHSHEPKSGLFGLRNWRRRYLVLWGGQLCLYSTDKTAAIDEVDLTDCSFEDVVIMSPDYPTTRLTVASKWRISVRTPTQWITFATNSELDMHGWVEALRNVFRKCGRRVLPDVNYSFDETTADGAHKGGKRKDTPRRSLVTSLRFNRLSSHHEP
ncbi:Aste57867_318 [Aphanomyces stellatus]|uniref:Aste57867_318 protein n=1 Tax=Aphanomyces stellatus TaxID=120398 RepID=A0A485K3C0_9STRA|nr:hypothetical protein As57867_000318 [Aphanomyces stellatus]VFT77544.1 Aste57867_318 [Aphanomyces stellatus]